MLGANPEAAPVPACCFVDSVCGPGIVEGKSAAALETGVLVDPLIRKNRLSANRGVTNLLM
jgi:hypothetical protein